MNERRGNPGYLLAAVILLGVVTFSFISTAIFSLLKKDRPATKATAIQPQDESLADQSKRLILERAKAQREAEQERLRRLSSLQEQSQATPPETKTVTLDEYYAIKTGMSYQEVATIIGEHGVELSRVELLGTITVMCQWKNSDGSNAIVGFQNNRVYQRSQFGLE